MRSVLVALFLFAISVFASAQTAWSTMQPLTSPQSSAGRPSTVTPSVQKWRTFADPNEGSFQDQVPVGWNDSGGLKRYNALQYRAWVAAVSPDGATTVSFGDPNEPSYTTPMMGFAPGSIYNGGGPIYIVEPLQSAQQYAANWGMRKLQGICTGVQVTASRARTDVSQQLGSVVTAMGASESFGDASFTCQRNGVQMSAYVFLGVTVLRLSATSALWYAESMAAFVAPAPVASVAAGVLAHMVKSFKLNLQWLGRQSQTAAQVSQIATETNNEISNIIMGGWDVRNGYVHTFTDPSTGKKYSVPDDVNYNYYWIDPSGNIVGTSTATSPGTGYRRLNKAP